MINTQATNDWDYTVKQVAIPNPLTGKLDTGAFFNMREDKPDAKPLGTVTKRYSIVNNRDILERVEDAFASAEMPWERNVHILKGGRVMKAVYDIGCKKNPETGKTEVFNERMTRQVSKGDIMGFRLIAQNSFDGSLRVSFALGLVRLVSNNGMTTMEKEISMIKKHSKLFKMDDFIAGDALETACKRLDKSIDVYRLLQNVEISQEQGLSILNNLTTERFKKTLSEKARESVARIWNSPTHNEDADRNLYNLNNAVTQHFTHEQDSFANAERSGKRILEYLEQAAHSGKDGKTFATLTKNEEITVVE